MNHPDLPLLVELQSVDLEMARVSAEIAALPKHVAEIEARLKAHLDQLDSDRKTLADHQKERKDHEREIAAIREKISKYRDQMATVKTNDQYKALQHEIEFAETGIREHEDKILEKMVLDEDLDQAVKTAKSRLDAEKMDVDKEKAVVKRRTADHEAALARLKTTRQEVAGKITEKTLSEYTRLSRKPPALSMVRNGTCQACRFMLRPQALNEVRTNNAIRYCESCKRLIYYAPPEVPVEAQTT